MNQGAQMTRRSLLLTLPALSAWPQNLEQSRKPVISVRKLNHVTLRVSDVKRSREFYQGLFGLALQNTQGSTAGLRIGTGPQHLGLSPAGPGDKAEIGHYCLSLDNFKVDAVLKSLAEHGVMRSENASNDPLKAWVRIRREASGGSVEGTPELYFTDPAGVRGQLQDTSYCGGAGALGGICSSSPTPAPAKGLIVVRDLSHITSLVVDQPRAVAFYRAVFGMRTQAFQGTMPILAVGAGPQFIALSGATGPAAIASAPSITHACLTMDNFNPDKVLKTLVEYGLKPRGNASGSAPPLVTWVRMRGEADGGAKEKTPELYFTDPDGIMMQLQDTSYCGGAGVRGENCGG
jgi:catechol 2,3-dioxygenase-like lactoylglutathione lyase family enzyme